MSISDLARSLRRRWMLFLGCILVGLSVGAHTVLSAQPSYTAHSQLLVSSTGSSDVDTLLNNNNLAAERVPSYVALVNAPAVVTEVVRRLQLRESPESVSRRITASQPLETALIDVTVRSDTAQGAYDEATAVGQVFGTVVGGFESGRTGMSPVQVTMVRPPELPTVSDSPGMLRSLALGLFLGAGLGVVVVVIRGLLDTSVRDAEDLRTKLGLRPLASITKDPDKDREPLVFGDDEESVPNAEGYRYLRTRLQFLSSNEGIRSVVVSSPEPEDGAPTVACKLAVVYGLAGLRVLLIDADLRNGQVADLLAVEGRAGLTDVLLGAASRQEVIQRWRGSTVDVLPSGPRPPNPSELLASESMRTLLLDSEEHYDLVMLAAPSLLDVTDGAVLATRVSGTVLVIRQSRSRWEKVRRAVQALSDVDARVLGAVVMIEPTRASELPRQAQRLVDRLSQLPAAIRSVRAGGSRRSKPRRPLSRKPLSRKTQVREHEDALR